MPQALGSKARISCTRMAEFAEKIAQVHADEALNRKLSEAGLAYIEQRHSAAAVTEALRMAVAG